MRGRRGYVRVYVALGLLLAIAVTASAAIGAFTFTPGQILRYLAQEIGVGATPAGDVLDRSVFFRLRLPRVLLAGLTGAALGVSGTLMQGLFRNPIVEPGLAGTSAGAALGAALVIVFGAALANWGALALPAAAFVGALLATVAVYRISASFGKVNVLTLLLAGIAINAMAAGGTGFLSYVARDPQARNITFWSLGTFTTADWRAVWVVLLAFVPGFVWAMHSRKSLNALMLGEDDAAALGLDTRAFIRRAIVANTVIVAAATAMVGVIAFVGLIVPHILRITRSSDYGFLVPASALLGALLMELIDVTARLVVAPAELPIGVITAVVGGPVFIWILLRQKYRSIQTLHG